MVILPYLHYIISAPRRVVATQHPLWVSPGVCWASSLALLALFRIWGWPVNPELTDLVASAVARLQSQKGSLKPIPVCPLHSSIVVCVWMLTSFFLLHMCMLQQPKLRVCACTTQASSHSRKRVHHHVYCKRKGRAGHQDHCSTLLKNLLDSALSCILRALQWAAREYKFWSGKSGVRGQLILWVSELEVGYQLIPSDKFQGAE